MAMPDPSMHVGVQADARLKAFGFGLTTEMLRDSAEWGIRHLYQATANEPPIGPPVTVWSKTTRRLREHALPLDWKSNRKNFATTISPDGKIAIVVAAGDEQTGKLGKPDPSTRSPKGQETKLAVHRNQLTFSVVSEGFPRPEILPDMQTWFLLLFLDDETDELFCELSLPERVGAGGYISEWKERIILPKTELGPEAALESDAPEPEPNITIRRRGSSSES